MCLFEGCVKFIVFAFNFVFVLVGVGLITLGSLYLFHYDDVTNAIPSDYGNLALIPILTISVGGVIFLISFFGCCGALRSSTCLLTTYAVILLIIFILQIALGVFTFLTINDEKDLRTKIDSSVGKVFSEALSRNNTKEVVDFIQAEFKCCGVKGPDFWQGGLPQSCCLESDCAKNAPYQQGCQSKFADFILDAGKIFGISILVLSATEVIGAIVSLCLANSIRNDHRRNPYYT